MARISEFVCRQRPDEAIALAVGKVFKHKDGALRVCVNVHGIVASLPIVQSNGHYYLELTTALSVPGHVYNKPDWQELGIINSLELA